MADNPTVFGGKAVDQLAKTVRDNANRMMNPRGERGRWQWHGGSSGAAETAYATITESGENDEFQEVTLYRRAIPDTFTTATCGGMDFDDMQFTLSESLGTETVLVPAGYKAGEALLVKWEVGVTEHAWTGWAVVVGPTLRCKTRIPTKVECCPTTQLIKFTEYYGFWYFGKGTGTETDACP